MASRKSLKKAKPVAAKKKVGKASVPKRKVKKIIPRKPAAKKTVTKKATAKRLASKKAPPLKKAAKTKKPVPQKKSERPVVTGISNHAVTVKEKETSQVIDTPAGEQVNNSDGQTTHENEPSVTATEDPMRSFDQKIFNKLTAKGDPHQHLRLSSRRKGTIKPVGKKPLWN